MFTTNTKKSKVKKLVWLVRKIDNSNLLDKYLASAKTDKTTFVEETMTADYNVFDCYDSRNCKPKFYDGHFESDFTLQQSAETEQSLNGYIDFLQSFDDELPKNFYTKRSNG